MQPSSLINLHHRSIVKKPVVHRFEFKHTPSATISNRSTKIANGNATISATIDLGKPLVAKVPGTPYSALDWPSLDGVLPSGVTLISAVAAPAKYPVFTLTFAVPQSASGFAVDVRNRSSVSVGAIAFQPSLDKIANWTGKPSVSNPVTFRSLRTVIVQIPLTSLSGQNVSALTRFTLDLKFRAPTVSITVVSDPVFDDMDRRLVANSDDLARFAVPLRTNPKPLKPTAYSPKGAKPQAKYDSTSFSWIDPSATYIKLSVARDGLYRVEAKDIPNFDLTQHGFTVGNIRCLNHGQEIPIWVDTATDGSIAAIEFYGEHLRGFPLDGMPEYYNVSTDTNAYWLTNTGNGPLLRYAAVAPNPAGATPVATGEVVLHHEQDHHYYLGDAISDESATQQRTEYGDSSEQWGERFEWYELHGPDDDVNRSIVRDSFYIAALPANTTSKTADLFFFMRGMTFDSHHAQISLNGSTISDHFFANFAYDTIHIPVALSQLQIGMNTIEVRAATTGSKIDQFYLDYYTVRYESPFAFSTDTAIVRGQWLTSIPKIGAVQQLMVNANNLHLYNLTNSTRIIPQSGNYFDQPSASQPLYAAALPTSLLTPVKISVWNDWKLLNAKNTADYIVITHPQFLAQAQKLALYRSQQGLKTIAVTTDQIFNTFNYGCKEAVAIRRFLNFAYYYYNGTPVSLVTILGDASWDPKKSRAGSNQTDFVPAFGNPVSDYYATLIEDGRFDTIQPHMLIARIPVASQGEAEAYIQKLVEYEMETPAAWNRKFLFVAGGDAGIQHETFVYADKEYLAPDPGLGLSTPPTDISGTIISRQDFTQTDPTQVAPIQDAIRAGQSVFYFSGHGATFTTDVILPDAKLLRNKGLYPLFMTLSCATGAFAEPDQISVNESYIRAADAGSVQTYGTTGFGEVTFDDILTTKWIQLLRGFDTTHDMSQPRTINMTELLTAAKLYAAGFGYSSPFTGHNALMQYSMLGDVATGFALRPQPELSAQRITASSIHDTTSRRIFNLSDSALEISAMVYNFGFTASRPVLIRIQDNGPNNQFFSVDTTLPNLNDSAMVFAQFPLTIQSIGRHRISVIVDPNTQFLETHREDDSASIDIQVNGFSATPFYPYEGSRAFCDVSASNVHFIVLTPSVATKSDRVELQIDTSRGFSNPIVTRSTNPSGNYYVTFDIPLPALPTPSTGVYWWRTRLVRATGDTSEWEYATFSTASGPRAEFSYNSAEQLQSTVNFGLASDLNGALFLPLQDSLYYEAWAQGGHDSSIQASHPISRLLQNNHVIYQFLGYNGYSIIVLSSDSTQIESVYEFPLDYQQFASEPYGDSVATIFDSVIAMIPTGRKVIVMSSGQPFFLYFDNNPSVTKALQSIGSANGFNGIGFFESQSIMGRKGDPAGTAKESRAREGSNGAHTFDTIVTLGTSGEAQTPFTASAKGYGKLRWTGTAAADRDILFTILGSRRDGSGTDALDTFHASQASSFDLSHIDARTYDRLAVKIDFTRSSSATQSPALSAIELEYDPAPEFLFTNDSIAVTPSVATEGTNVIAHYGVSLLTCTPSDSAVVQMTRQYNGKTSLLATHIIPHLDGHGSVQLNDTISTLNEQGIVGLTAEVNPNETQNEQLLFNDIITGHYTVGRDTTLPSAEILFADPPSYFDDHRLPYEGYASKLARITIDLVSNNPVRDTSRKSIVANLQYFGPHPQFYPDISADNPSSGFITQFETMPTGPIQARLRITPPPNVPFAPGLWLLDAFLTDASGNRDTVEQYFTVSATNGIEHLMNYPNPFKDKTDITFVLKSDSPADVKVIIYTVSGRKIRTITPIELRTGFNHTEWDGRDDKGNDVGNGTYLYRVVITGTNPDGTDISDGITEKAVRSR